jgi:hypothetical protein
MEFLDVSASPHWSKLRKKNRKISMKFTSTPPVLITSCISSSDIQTKLIDPEKRLFHVLEGIDMWLQIQPELHLVLCDGSNFDLGPIVKNKFPNANIECLHHQNSSEEVFKNGKGYGEGEIIKYALNNSKKLALHDVFIKCTGKLWVTNFEDCLKEWNGKFMADAHFSRVFHFRPAKIDCIDTRFYIVNKQFYIDNLLHLYLQTNFEKNCSIEHFFLKKIQDLKLNRYIFSKDPIVCGVGGGSGEYYKNNLRRSLKKKIKKFYLKKDKLFSRYIFEEPVLSY